MAVDISPLWNLLTYFSATVLVLFGLNLWFHGFIMAYIRVKASRGAKIMLLIATPISYYYKIGVPAEQIVIYKDRSKEEKRLSIPEGSVIRFLGINWLIIEEDKNAVMRLDWKAVSGFDAPRYNNLYLRALYKPLLQDTIKIIILIGVIITIFEGAYIIMKLTALESLINSLKIVSGANI
jgi:hypothetical protein